MLLCLVKDWLVGDVGEVVVIRRAM